MQSPYNALDDQLTTQRITMLRTPRFTLEPKHNKTVTITTGNTPLIPKHRNQPPALEPSQWTRGNNKDKNNNNNNKDKNK